MLRTLDDSRAVWASGENEPALPTLASSSPGITHLQGTTLRLTAFPCALGSQSCKGGGRSSAPSMAPCDAYLFPVSVDAGQALTCTLWALRNKSLGGLDQNSGAQTVRLLAVYIGCFILHSDTC